MILNYLKKFINKMGYDVTKYPNKNMIAKKKFFQIGKFDLIIDVGANVGQFVDEVRGLYKYEKQIISFEPLSNEFLYLKSKLSNDSKWVGHNIALGNDNGIASINVSNHSPSSSILYFNENYLQNYSNLKIKNTENILIKRLDDIFQDINKEYKPTSILLKIDTQGFEKKILDGAEKSINSISGLILEISIQELYKGETLFSDFIQYLNKLNFDIYHIEPYYYDEKLNNLLQIELYLFKKKIY